MGNGKRKGEKKLAKKKKRMEEMERSKPNRIRRQIRGKRTLVFFLAFFPTKGRKGKTLFRFFFFCSSFWGFIYGEGKTRTQHFMSAL